MYSQAPHLWQYKVLNLPLRIAPTVSFLIIVNQVRENFFYLQSALSRLLNCEPHSWALLLEMSKQTEWVPRFYPRNSSLIELSRKQHYRQTDLNKVVRINFAELGNGPRGGLSHLQTALPSGPWVRTIPWGKWKLCQGSGDDKHWTVTSYGKVALAAETEKQEKQSCFGCAPIFCIQQFEPTWIRKIKPPSKRIFQLSNSKSDWGAYSQPALYTTHWHRYHLLNRSCTDSICGERVGQYESNSYDSAS